MIEFLELLILLSGAALISLRLESFRVRFERLRSTHPHVATFYFLAITLLGCILVATILHEPVPRVHDEFSYRLMGDTFAHRRLSNSSLPLPEFFDTFHVLMRPVYVSKYFPAQGIFLAIGEILTGHPAVGIWISSALTCAAVYWMLRPWAGPAGSLFGAFVFVIQYGIFSYWSQSYWGGMIPAMGGALVMGALRRLWDQFSWKVSVWLAVGIITLVNSRPLEGLLVLLPITGYFTARFLRDSPWRQSQALTQVLLPAAAVLFVGGFLTCSYNRAITGSLWIPPYVVHEQQYQESPQFTFLPLRPKLAYSSPWVQYYYEIYEMRLYQGPRIPKYLVTGITMRLKIWWGFFCGVLLTPALVIPPLLRKGRIRYVQLALLLALVVLLTIATPQQFFLQGIIDILALIQIAVLWVAFDDPWERLAIGTSALLLLEGMCVKFFFAHYFAPAACLVLYLQVSGMRRIWQWNPQTQNESQTRSRSERRRLSRQSIGVHRLVSHLRGLGYALPIACVLSLVIRVEARLNGWHEGSHSQTGQALLMKDWSLRRAELEKWLEQQPKPQLVFVWYSLRHRVNDEWVYNRADIMHSQVVWARDLGADHNQLLLKEMAERTVWFLDADSKDPKLIPYAEVRGPRASAPIETQSGTEEDREE